MESASHATGESSPEDIQTRPGGPAPGSGPGGHRSLADRIADARAMVAYQDLGGGARLAFKVRPVSVAEAAQAGVLVGALQRAVGQARQPDPEDMTGLEAAEADARRGTVADQLEEQLRWIEHGKCLARACVVAVQDVDDPDTWRRLEWVADPDDAGDDEVDGEPLTRLHLETVLDASGLMNIAFAALRLVEEAAGRWGRFRR